MKNTILIFFLISFYFANTIHADEGMWMPSFLKMLNEADMQKMGCKLSADEIYSVNQTSLKDAVILFGGGCTGDVHRFLCRLFATTSTRLSDHRHRFG